jgi:hypothetical protein
MNWAATIKARATQGLAPRVEEVEGREIEEPAINVLSRSWNESTIAHDHSRTRYTFPI